LVGGGRLLTEILLERGIKPIEFYLWQGRARGKQGGDVDVYIKVGAEYRELCEDLDFVNRILRSTGRSVQGYMTWVDGFLVDARIGVGEPPEKPYVRFSDLEAG